MNQPMTLDEMTRLSWRSAMEFFLAEFPLDDSTEDIMEMIENLDNRIMVWEPFENWPGPDLAEQIEVHQRSLLNDFQRVAGILEDA